VALALVDGTSGLTRPMELTGHYLLDVDQVGSPGDFLRGFTDRIDDYGVHVRSHPPGLVLLLWGLAQVGLAGSGAAAALVIGGGAAAVPALLLITRELAGEAMARRALPFLVLAPAALYVASTGDALFAGVGAWAAAGVVLATGRLGRWSDALAAAGGAAFGVALLLSYGLTLLVLLPLAVAVVRRRARPLVVAAGAGTAVLGAAGLAGFWWIDGLLTTRGEYLESVASIRPYGYFLFANLVGLAIVVGPATLAGVARLVGAEGLARRLVLVVGPVLAMVALADLSGMSKGEAERIWLPFALCLLPAGALVAEARDAGAVRRWLWVQVGCAVAVTAFVRTHW
jgi:heme exporter protein D